MSTARWQRLFELFEEARAREADERQRYLAEACGQDVALRAEIDALLAADDSGASFLDRPLPVFAHTDELDAEALVGRQLGPYRILRLLGEGGMGQVYEAEQREPLERRVALKLIKLGMDTREVMARFAAERRTLALMGHPAIAVVHDAGATPEGRPYFVMELVDGQPINAYCDARRLTVRERLDLFLGVCAGVEHAHRRGVLHRDLKPSNILVSERDGRPSPKVIDFGISKAIGAEGSGTLDSRLGLPAGTPEYMSPEQASFDGDTRTDVYSLGVLLYELLTGVLPFERQQLQGVGPIELLRVLREQEPEPPSRRVAKLPHGGSVASHRGTDARGLQRQLAGELDWIVTKALAKEREDRYPSVAELATDLERHLHGEPVLAGPPGRLYRLSKLVRRHRVETAAAALLLIALVGFGTTMAVQSARLANALAAAEREGTTAKRVSELLVHLLEQTDPAAARGEEITVRQVLDAGAESLARELAGEPEVRARLHETIGRLYHNLGVDDRAAAQLEQALRLRRSLGGGEHPDVAAALQRLGEVELSRGNYDRARQLAKEALALQQRVLALGDPARADTLDLLGSLARESGDFQRAAWFHERALTVKRAALGETDPEVAVSWNLLGRARRWQGDLETAEVAYRNALTIWRRSRGEIHPQTSTGRNNLALVLHARGKHQEARRAYEELLPLDRKLLGSDHPDFLIGLVNFGKLLSDMGDLRGAEAIYREALTGGRRALGAAHPQLAVILAELGLVLGRLGRLDEALAVENEALEIRRRALGDDHYYVAASRRYLAEVHAARGDRATAEPLFALSVQGYRRELGEHPATAAALVAHGLFLVQSDREKEAEPLLREAVAMLRAKVPPGDRRLALAKSTLGDCLARLGHLPEAEHLLRESLAVLAVSETPETEVARGRLAALQASKGRRFST